MRILTLILSLLVSLTVYGQTTLYSEDFSNDWKKGAITYGGVTPSQPTDGNWSWVNVGSPDNDGGSASSWNDMSFIDGAAVMSTNGATSSTLAFRWNDVNNGSSANRVDWYSKIITGNYSSISLSIDYAIGNGSSANSLYVYYIINGGTPVLFGSSVNQSSASGTFTISSLSCTTSIQIYAKAITRDFNASYVLIDNVSITGNVALPIELLYFKPKYEDDIVKLRWSTASEHNNDYFTIEKSYDGFIYEVIKTIPGAGNSTQVINYYEEDRSFTSSIVYYRLKQTDFDGQFVRTDWESVFIDKKVTDLEITPNPFDQELNITFISEINGVKTLNLTDLIGNVVYHEDIMVFDGLNNVKIKLNTLSCGVYLLNFDKMSFKVEHY